MNIVLVGNPNVGKSVIFNALTGSYVTVSNYPGTTVDISRGELRLGGCRIRVTDTPGVNSLSPHSEDEKVTRQVLSASGISCIVQVADEKNMTRSLLLTLELSTLGIPLVLDLNMSDEARERGISVDVKKLSQRLGIDVVQTVAITGEGIAALKEAILRARVPKPIAGKDGAPQASEPGAIASMKRRNRIADGLAKETVSRLAGPRGGLSETIGRLAIRPLSGIPILLLVMVVMYVFVGKFAAGKGVDLIEHTLFGNYINPFLAELVNRYIGIGWAREILIGEYGLITMALTYAFGIILPIVTAFFIFFGVLEDSGYLPRLSVLSDRVFRTIGLNGRAVLPMVLGLGCGTMATLTVRILDTRKERILASLLLTLAIPCSAQLGVIMGMLGGVSIRALLLWVGILLAVMMGVGYAASKIIPGSRSPFMQEIPPIRMPQMKNILAKTFARLKWYLKEAVPLFVLGTLLLFVSDKIGFLKWIEHAMSPLVEHLLGLPSKATEAFIVGFLRRDYGVAGLYMLSKGGMLDKIQVLVSVVVITLFVPCIAQFFVTVKERGPKAAVMIGAFVFVTAFLAGGLLNFALRRLLALGIAVI